jgi:raffinose/stachyose/melibiose transport system permease protein
MARAWLAELPRRLVVLFLAFFCLTVIFSLLWITVTSLKSNAQLFANVWSLPTSLRLANYVNAWTLGGMGIAFLNSVLVSFSAAIGLVALAAPAAYILSRAEFRGRELFINGIAGGMGVPAVFIFIPVYLLLAQVGLSDSLPGLFVVYLGVQMPFTVYLLTGFFATLPVELEEAAIVDGASELQVFVRVMLPLAQPGLITAAIFNVIYLWKEFFWGLVLLRTNDHYTLGVALNALREGMSFSADWVGLFAAVVIVMGPALLIYAFLSRRMLRAVTFGALR